MSIESFGGEDSGPGFPKIAEDSQGNMHIIYDETDYDGGSGIDRDVFYRMFNITTQEWTGRVNSSFDVISSPLKPSFVSMLKSLSWVLRLK